MDIVQTADFDWLPRQMKHSVYIVNPMNTKRTSSFEKSERNIYAYSGMSEKWGLLHTNQEKSGQPIHFLLKKGG